MFNDIVIDSFLSVLDTHSIICAFFIAKKFHTYEEFAQCISKIRNELQSHNIGTKNIGLIENDDLETYASIFALWLEGLAYVPMSSDAPLDRNRDVIEQAGITAIIDSSNGDMFSDYDLIKSSSLTNFTENLIPKRTSDDELAYILFTSGTTGRPKGVPISRKNISAFVESFKDVDIKITNEDKCLQMFNLTFDLSVMSYLLPLLSGACVYTVPKDQIKYSYVFELLDEYGITMAMMVPSLIHYFRPYFEEMHFPKFKYNMFAGEALDEQIMKEWQQCIPNATITSSWGPTETTIICTYYPCSPNYNLEINGVLSIGKVMGDTEMFVVDEDNNFLPPGKKGEFCLAGSQVTPGYWNNEEKNKTSFFNKEVNGEIKRIYKTGDLGYINEDGYGLYLGRIDFQTKIQGFRVELSEVEYHAKEFYKKTNVVALALTNKLGTNEIVMVIERESSDTTNLLKYLASKMPSYMMPTQLKFEPNFPLNINGKIDRNILKSEFSLKE